MVLTGNLMGSDEEYEAKRRELFRKFNEAANSKHIDQSKLRSVADDAKKLGISFKPRFASRQDKEQEH